MALGYYLYEIFRPFLTETYLFCILITTDYIVEVITSHGLTEVINKALLLDLPASI